MAPPDSPARAALRSAGAIGLTGNSGAWAAIETPMGTFLVASFEGALVQSALPGTPPERFVAELVERHPGVHFSEAPQEPVIRRAKGQLLEYAAGTRTQFDLPMKFEGTEFQKRVWGALQRIPYGQTWTYGQLAHEIGRPNAFRAVGQANNQNPLAPFVPCHRVINAGGGLGGYGGGMQLKRTLLGREGIHFDEDA